MGGTSEAGRDIVKLSKGIREERERDRSEPRSIRGGGEKVDKQ